MKKSFLVSVVVFSYNQGMYIKQCLKSILKQKTDFEYEIYIYDDASNDNSVSVIKQYADKYPDKIRCCLKSVPTLYSNPQEAFYEDIIGNIDGEYIAFCEADDYWNDDNKLQIQFNEMNKQKECSICVHQVELWDCSVNKIMGFIPNQRDEKNENIVNCEKNVVYRWMREGAFFGFNSFFIRRSCIDKGNVPNFMITAKCNDYAIFLKMACNGRIIYIPKNMATKRVYNVGALSSKIRDDEEKISELKRMCQVLLEYDQYSKGVYHDEIENIILFIEIKIKLYKNREGEKIGLLDFYSGKMISKKKYCVIKNKVINILENNKFFYKYHIHRTKKLLKKAVMLYRKI